MSYAREVEVAIEAAREAGALLLADFHRPGGPRGEGAHADADTEAENLIRARLLAATNWSYLGEETGRATGTDPHHIWIVDPNDATAAFLKGRRGSAVSIAALRDGEPVLGVVFAFVYPDDRGDLITWAEGTGPILRNGVPVETDLATAKLERNSIVIVSQDADRNADANIRCVAPARYLSLPSIAYRLALVAVGEGVAAVSLNGPTSWDFAAGNCLVRAAGGELVDEAGRPVTYDRDGRSSTRRCFGGAPTVVAELARRPWEEVFSRPTESPSLLGLAGLERGRAVADVEVLRRAQGCLLAAFAAESLGSLVEFGRTEAVKATYPSGVRDLADGGAWNTLGGQLTDDGEESLMLARCIIKETAYDPGAALESYLHWFQSGPFDMGGTTSAALGAAARGKTRSDRLRLAACAARTESQANGSLMRAAPLGIFGWRDPRKATELARQDSALTHPDPVCVESCAAYVAAISTAIGKKTGPRETYEAALVEARRGGNQAVVNALVASERTPPARFDGPDAGWVLIALQNAFYRLLHATSLEEGVVETASMSGDADTTGIIAGGLLGAVHGRDAVPARWRRIVLTCRPTREAGAVHPRPREFWPVDALELAERLTLVGS